MSALILLLIACCAGVLSQINPNQLRDDVAAYVPANASELSVAQFGDPHSESKFLIAAWSTRSKVHEGASTTVVVVSRIGQTSRLVQRFRIENGYSPKAIVRPEFTFRGTPVVLVQVQFGAAATGIEVFGLRGKSVRRLCSIDANDFEFVTLDSAPLLLAHEDTNLFDVPRLYRWTGSSFADDSINHREFYRNLVTAIRGKYDVSTFAPAVQRNFAEIVNLSGDTQKADR